MRTLTHSLTALFICGLLAAPAIAAAPLRLVAGDGTAPAVALLLEAFQQTRPGTRIVLAGEGTGGPPAALIDGRAAAVVMAGDLSEAEEAGFRRRNGYSPARILIARGQLVVYVHPTNRLDGISLRELDAVYSRQRRCELDRAVETWRDLGLDGASADRRIRAYVEMDSIATFREAALCGGDLRDDIGRMTAAGALVQAVADDPQGIGVGSRSADTTNVRIIPLTPAGAGDAMSRPVYLYVNRAEGDPLPEPLASFITFTLGSDGRAILERAGYQPPARVAAIGVNGSRARRWPGLHRVDRSEKTESLLSQEK